MPCCGVTSSCCASLLTSHADRVNRVCCCLVCRRSPYDLARDSSLWLKDAYATLDDALEAVQVDAADIDRAIAAMANSRERVEARAKLRKIRTS